MSMLIKHQMQPTPVTCFCTSLAMLSNTPAADVIAAYHDDYYACKQGTADLLAALDIPYKWFKSVDSPAFDEPGAYLITVPSLNIEAGMHAIVVEMTEDDWRVLDPVRGRDDRRYYVEGAPTSPLEVTLRGLVIDAFIPPEYVRARYEQSC